MIKTVKLDKKDNYLLDSSTGEKLEKYDPDNPNTILILTLDNSVLNVDSNKIQSSFGNIIVQHNEDKYIIDDGYQNILIKAGYIVFENFDIENCYNKADGIVLRDDLIGTIYNSFLDVLETKEASDNGYEIITYDEYFKYTINIDTINNIVAKNIKRKDNSLPFFPFDKNMDKYGTIYISMYAQKLKKIPQELGNSKYVFADKVLFKLLNKLGSKYKFNGLDITKRIIYWK